MKITDADWKLLDLLRANARIPTAALARTLGVSRTTVQSRIERLEKANIITGYTVRLADTIEQGQVKAHVMITVAPKLSPRVGAELRKLVEVRALHTISGAYDLIAVISTRSTSELDNIVDQIGAIPGVERTMTSIILSTKFER